MTRKIEDKAKAYLINEFKHESWSFCDKDTSDKGFDIWLNEKNQKPIKIELKATDSAYQRPSNIFERLVFNAEIEKQLFESGESIIARVFMGSTPPRIFLITNAIFTAGAKLNSEARYVVRGKINYENSISELI